jgi:hypothetical protein
MAELGIETLCAHFPQAKGRVERTNQTLQDRLVKEMRLEGIESYEAANAFLPSYIPAYRSNHAARLIPMNHSALRTPLRLFSPSSHSGRFLRTCKSNIKKSSTKSSPSFLPMLCGDARSLFVKANAARSDFY